MGRHPGVDHIVATWSAWAGLPEESQLIRLRAHSKINRNEVLQSMGDMTEALTRAP